MSDANPSDRSHLDAEALDRYRRRVAPPSELLAADAHIAHCDRCYDAVRAETDAIELPPAAGDAHITYEELEAFVDGRVDALDREWIAAHTAACARCSAELADLAATRDTLTARVPRALHQVRIRRSLP